MDFDSPEEKEFPGLYASEATDAKSKKSKEESDYSEGDHEKLSKKDLRRKDKKDKGKDRGYAALEGESSPEEELDTKSPSKSKKSKTFKFTSSKSKEKREKSRDKDKKEKTKEKEKEKEKTKDKEKDKEKTKEKEKEKDKEKTKDKKDKKDKKHAQHTGDDSETEEVLALGYPVFGVSVNLATERSRCHDGIELPLVVRDCIDYLQEYGLRCETIYKLEPIKSRVLHYKRLYNNRERQPKVDELDVPTACSLLKLFLKELPEPVLTTDLIGRFEEIALQPEITKQQHALKRLVDQLPKCNRILLSWVFLHFDAVVQQERFNKLSAQSLAMLLSPTLQMSHRLMVAILIHSAFLFPDVKLIKYVPPLTSSSPKLPEKPEDIQLELRKQESLLTQIHSEMNAGFITKKREEQLWEVQRIITQLKRKLRSFEKKQEKSVDELEPPQTTQTTGKDTTDSKLCKQASKTSPVEQIKQQQSQPMDGAKQITKRTPTPEPTPPEPQTQSPLPQNTAPPAEHTNNNNNCGEGFYIDPKTGLLLVPTTHPDWATLVRLQLEYQDLMEWKLQLQARITSERAELFRLKQVYQHEMAKHAQQPHATAVAAAIPEEPTVNCSDEDFERIIENYVRENKLLEHKKQMLAKELFEERRECIALQVELALKRF